MIKDIITRIYGYGRKPKKEGTHCWAPESVRGFRFCGPSDDPDEQTAVTEAYRYLVIQLKRLAGPLLSQGAAAQLSAIDVEINNIYSAYDAREELDALLPDIEAALETLDDTSMGLEQSFSKRNRYAGPGKEITIREDAPKNLRYFALQAAVDLEWGPSQLRDVVCRVLRTVPDSSNWSEYPNIWSEVECLVERCEWFRVYDIIEAIHNRMHKEDERYRSNTNVAARYAGALNEFFIEEGIGWQLVDGHIVTRGTEAFEAVVTEATAALKTSERPTAARQDAALHRLSAVGHQRPELNSKNLEDAEQCTTRVF